MGNLDLIVQMHNNVELTLLPVERPLLQSKLVSSYICTAPKPHTDRYVYGNTLLENESVVRFCRVHTAFCINVDYMRVASRT